MPLFEATYGGKKEGLKWFVYWRLFYLVRLAGWMCWVLAAVCGSAGTPRHSTPGHPTPPARATAARPQACSELFAFNGGNDWGVAHMLFAKRQLAA